MHAKNHLNQRAISSWINFWFGKLERLRINGDRKASGAGQGAWILVGRL